MRIAGSRRWGRWSRISCMRSACPIARVASWRKTRLGAARSRPGGTASTTGSCDPIPGSTVRRYFLRLAGRPRRRQPCRRRAAGCLRRSRGSGRVRQASGRGHQRSHEPEFSWRHPHRGWPHRPEAAGLFGLVAAARAMAIRYHVMDRSTSARLAGVKALFMSAKPISTRLAKRRRFLDLIVSQQVEDIAHGIPPSNAVSVKRLSARDRDRLRVALKRSPPSMS